MQRWKNMQKKKKIAWVILAYTFFRKSYCLIQLPKTQRPKDRNRPKAPWDSIALVIRYRYMLNMLSQQQTIEKVIVEFSSEKIRSKFF